MRLALISREYPPFLAGGIGAYAHNFSLAMAAAGHEVHIITERAHGHSRIECDGSITIHRLHTPHDDAQWPFRLAAFSLAAARLALELAAAGRIDAIEVPECEGPGAALQLLRRARSVPTIAHLHTPTEALVGLRSLPARPSRAMTIAAERLSIALADAVIAPSQFIAEWARRHYQLSSAPTVIPYPLAPARSLPQRASAPRAVLYAGRLETRKGVESLAMAWRIVAPRAPGWTLRLAGADTSTAPGHRSMRAHLDALLAPVRSSVEFLGPLTPPSLDRARASAAFAVVPSLWENYPNVCMEAMDAGLPIVASDHGGMAEMLAPECSMLHRAGDADDLARALLAMITAGDEARARMGAAAAHRIRAVADPGAVVHARISHLRRLSLERPPADRAATALAWRRIHRTIRDGEDAIPDLLHRTAGSPA